MHMNVSMLNSISETAYLNAANSARYRAIMRVFYTQAENMNYHLDKSTVLTHLYADTGMPSSYTEDHLEQDLNQLVQWKNLTPIQDPRAVTTIADYKNRQYRYVMSEKAIKIERMTIDLEELFHSAAMSNNLFQRLHHFVLSVPNLLRRSEKEQYECWNDFLSDFGRLSQNEQDYLREFFSVDAERLMQSAEFVVHKDKVLTYLREFVSEMQAWSQKIQSALQSLDKAQLMEYLEHVCSYEASLPHISTVAAADLEAQLSQRAQGCWHSFMHWFAPEDDPISESQRVLDATNDIIRRILQNAVLLVQLQNGGISRKRDYETAARMFARCPDLDEAHRLSSWLFGAQHLRHFTANADRSTDNIFSSTYEETPYTYTLDPHTRTYRPRLDKTGFSSRQDELLRQKKLLLEQKELERRCVMEFVKNGVLDFSAIDEAQPITPDLRRIFLRWITAANRNRSKQAVTEYGQHYTLVRGQGECVLHCTDGELHMPAYRLTFQEKEV